MATGAVQRGQVGAVRRAAQPGAREGRGATGPALWAFCAGGCTAEGQGDRKQPFTALPGEWSRAWNPADTQGAAVSRASPGTLSATAWKATEKKGLQTPHEEGTGAWGTENRAQGVLSLGLSVPGRKGLWADPVLRGQGSEGGG